MNQIINQIAQIIILKNSDENIDIKQNNTGDNKWNSDAQSGDKFAQNGPTGENMPKPQAGENMPESMQNK